MAARAETPGFDLTVHANQRPQEGRFNLVHASDVEGPIFLGDDARDIVSKFVRPPQPKDGIDYGAIFYDEVHCAIKEEYMNKGLGQIGSNIVLYLPALLYFGATDRRLLMQALQSRRTPGSSSLTIGSKDFHFLSSRVLS